ncbi:MAG: PEP-CTERM/exosortase system-associated acyltransferase [Pseudomonadota bacterium]
MSETQVAQGDSVREASGERYAAAAEFYRSLFDVRLARSDEDVHTSQALRYRVYCEETGYLPKDDNPAGLEHDSFDAQSEAVLLIHKATGACVGTVRVIIPDDSAPGRLFPAMDCSEAMLSLVDKDMPLATTGELSRFTIAPEFRRRAGDTLYQQVYDFGIEAGDMRRIIPYMALGLFAGIMEIVTLHTLSHLCAIIDPALLRMLKRLHLHFPPVGGVVEYHGMRQPVFVSTRALYDGMTALPDAYLRIVNRDGQLQLP